MMKIKVVFDGGVEKEFISEISVREIDKNISNVMFYRRNFTRLLGDYFLIPYNKILYIEEVKEWE